MTKAVIPLSKPFTVKALQFPSLVSEKIDGVPIRVDLLYNDNGKIKAFKVQTRQGKPAISCIEGVKATFVAVFGYMTPGAHYTFFAEVTHPDCKSFKQISGKVRKQRTQTGLQFNIFDFVDQAVPDEPFGSRIEYLENMFARYPNVKSSYKMLPVGQHKVFDYTELLRFKETFLKNNPNAEGLIIRSWNALSQPNTRTNGYLKSVIRPTLDLPVVNYNRAYDKHKTPLSRVGSLNVRMPNGTIQLVGAGKLPVAERERLWRQYQDKPLMPKLGFEPICEISYKKDPSYEKLREPVFLHWRPEKN